MNREMKQTSGSVCPLSIGLSQYRISKIKSAESYRYFLSLPVISYAKGRSTLPDDMYVRAVNEGDRIYCTLEIDVIRNLPMLISACKSEEQIVLDYISACCNMALKELTVPDTAPEVYYNPELCKGTDTLIPGVHYFMSESLFERLESEQPPLELFVPDTELLSDNDTQVELNSNINVLYYIKKNDLLRREESKDSWFTGPELDSFTSTFFKYIYKYTTHKFDPLDQSDRLYKHIIDYYINKKSDCVSMGLELVTGPFVPNKPFNPCNCQPYKPRVLNIDDLNRMTCIEQYRYNMKTALVRMMTDIEVFYLKYLFSSTVTSVNVSPEATPTLYTMNKKDPEGNTCFEPNLTLLSMLERLIQDFINAGYNLSFSQDGTHKINYRCNCPDEKQQSRESACNYLILENFLKAIGFLKDRKVNENINKIKEYGKQFGELLDKLYL